MDGENNGKPYFVMDDLGGFPIIFGNTHIVKWNSNIRFIHLVDKRIDQDVAPVTKTDAHSFSPAAGGVAVSAVTATVDGDASRLHWLPWRTGGDVS